MNETDPIALAISNCDREPIHVLGTIQPFGCLVATDLSLESISHVADNVSNYLPVQPADLLGQSVSRIFSDTLIHDLRNAASSHNIKKQRQRLGHYDLGGTVLDISLHRSGDRLIVELESLDGDELQQESTITRVQSILGYLQGEMESDTILQKTVTVLRHTIHFDRVMAYQFLHDGSGEVVAESCSSLYEPYLGLRYPSTDIPQPVRDIALKMPVRTIADVCAKQVAILSNEDGNPLDLSLTYLRGVSPIHVEYLTNMGVNASMNIAIIVQGKLWGLFACHHYSPRLLSAELRSSCELFSQIFSLNLQQVLAQERLQNRKNIASTTHHLFETPRESFQFIQSAPWLKETLGPMMQADGLAIIAQEQVGTSGDTPNDKFILELICQCRQESTTDVIPIEQLRQVSVSSETAMLGKSAGALVIKISELEQLYLIFFRNAVSSKIRWGGNPQKEIVYGPFGPCLRPRASFEEYIEIVTGHCPRWSPTDIDMALEFRSGLLYLAISQIEVIQQEAIQQQRHQNLLIAELNHRVKNILTLIRSITRQTRESATSVADYTVTLEKRIAALASAHDLVAGHGLEWPRLEELLKIEVRPYLAESKDRVQLSGPNVGLKADFVPTFVLVLHELVSNAAKYGALSVPEGQVNVRWYLENGGLTLLWQEQNGPRVSTPTRQGFGRKLIERSIAYEFEGTAQLKFAPQGVEAAFWIPNELVLCQSQDIDVTASPSHPPNETLGFRDGRVLIVEDNMLIALEQEDIVKSLGFETVDTVPRVSTAIKLLQSQQYTLGILDIDLKKETSFAIAEELLHQDIPFLFTTGYDSKYTVPKHLEGIIRLKKPVTPDKLSQALDSMLGEQ